MKQPTETQLDFCRGSSWPRLRQLPQGILRHLSLNVLNLLSRGANFVLFWIIINKLGASVETDWFYFVYGFVYFFIFIAFYSIECALVPVWPGLSRKEQEDFLRTNLHLGWISSIPMQALGFLVSFHLAAISGFVVPEAKGQAVLLSVLLFAQPVITYFSALFSSLLQASGLYLLPITHLFWRTAGVLPILLLPNCSGITCLTIAYTVGELLRFVILMVAVSRQGWKIEFISRVPLAPYKPYFVAMAWMALVLSASVINPYIDLIMVGRLGQGSATLVEYAGRLRGLPVLVLSGILVVLFGDWAREQGLALPWKRILSNALRIAVLGLLFSGSLIMTSSYWIPLVFSTQQFNTLQTDTLDRLMVWYLMGVPFLIANGLLSRGFMVWRQFRLLALLAVIAPVLNVILNFIFIRFSGIEGVAISTTVLDGVLFCAYLVLGAKLNKPSVAPHT